MKIVKYLFWWIPVRESFVYRMTGYFDVVLKDKGIADNGMLVDQARLSLVQEGYNRARGRKGRVCWGRFLSRLEDMSEDVYKFVKGYHVRDQRVKEILQFYARKD